MTSQRMKPRAMSEWIEPAASSARPCLSVHERASVSPTVKNVMSPRASLRRRTTSSSADAPERNSAASSSESLRELHLEGAVDPAGPVLERDERLRRQRLELRGEIAFPLGERVAFVEVVRAGVVVSSASCRFARSPDFASFRTRSSRRSTCSRSATMSSRRSVLEVAAWIRAGREAVEHGEKRVGLPELTGDLCAARDVDNAGSQPASAFFDPDNLGEPVEAIVGYHGHPEVRLLRHVRICGSPGLPHASAR